MGIAGPGFGYEHGHGVGQVAAGHEEELDGVIEAGGIAAARCDHGEELAEVVAEQGGRQDRLASIHPVDVAAEGVDFAVVGNVAVGVGELPGGEGVGGEALVDETKTTPHFRIRQLQIEIGNLGGQQKALVNNRAAGKRRDVEEALLPQIGGAHFLFGPFADDIELALQSIFVHAVGALDENLFDIRLRAARQAADGVGIDRCVTPTKYCQAFVLDDLFHNGFALQPLVRFNGEEYHTHAVFAGGGKRKAQAGAFSLKKGMRDLDQHAGAVARLGVATAGATVRQIDQDFDPLHNDVVRFFARDVGYKSNPTGIVLMAGIVKSLRLWQSSDRKFVAHMSS